MSEAVVSALSISQRMFSWIDNKVSEHFTNDNGKELSVRALAEKIVREFDLKYTECVGAINLYLRFRPEIEMLSDRDNTIRLIVDEPNKERMGVKECALRHYDRTEEVIPVLLEEAFQIERKRLSLVFKCLETDKIVKPVVRMDGFKDKVAEQLKIKPYAAYHCIKTFLEERPELFVKRGSEGGIAYVADWQS